MPEIKPGGLDYLLRAFRFASRRPRPHPWASIPNSQPAIDAADRMTAAIADFIDAARAIPGIGYEQARANLAAVVRMLPAAPNPATMRVTAEEIALLESHDPTEADK